MSLPGQNWNLFTNWVESQIEKTRIPWVDDIFIGGGLLCNFRLRLFDI